MVSAEGVAWFLLGEGSLCLEVRKYKNKVGFRAHPRIVFYNTEKFLLQEIRNWLVTNEIVNYTYIHPKRSEKHYSVHALRVDGFKNCQKLLTLILPHLEGKKKKQAELILESCVIADRKKLGKEKFLQMVKYHDLVSDLAGNRRVPKYSYDYFKNLWGS